jgi:GDPmannose 4,6-dehydratase
MPEYTSEATGVGTLRILEAIRKSGIKARFYQAASSEMFGSARPPQNENTPFEPQSPYAVAKVFAYWTTRYYRQGYGLYACNGILFNHESPRRGETFVTRKITRGLASIMAGKMKFIYLGNLDARRDWGYAPEYVEAMWRMLQSDQPADFVIGTGEAHSVREFLDEAFGYVGLDWHAYVRMDPYYLRPIEVNHLMADASQVRQVLGWEPRVLFKDLVRIMVDADLEAIGLQSAGEGRKILEQHHSLWHTCERQMVSLG